MYTLPPTDADASPASSPAPRSRRSNWGLRLLAVLLSALTFVGFWLGAQHNSPATSTPGSSQYAPPTSGGLLPPGGLVPHGSTHVS